MAERDRLKTYAEYLEEMWDKVDRSLADAWAMLPELADRQVADMKASGLTIEQFEREYTELVERVSKRLHEAVPAMARDRLRDILIERLHQSMRGLYPHARVPDNAPQITNGKVTWVDCVELMSEHADRHFPGASLLGNKLIDDKALVEINRTLFAHVAEREDWNHGRANL